MVTTQHDNPALLKKFLFLFNRVRADTGLGHPTFDSVMEDRWDNFANDDWERTGFHTLLATAKHLAAAPATG